MTNTHIRTMDKNDEIIRIFTGTEILCLTLKAELEKIEIPGMIKNVFQTSISTGFFAGSPSTVELYICKSELEKALPIIKDFVEKNQE